VTGKGLLLLLQEIIKGEGKGRVGGKEGMLEYQKKLGVQRSNGVRDNPINRRGGQESVWVLGHSVWKHGRKREGAKNLKRVEANKEVPRLTGEKT